MVSSWIAIVASAPDKLLLAGESPDPLRVHPRDELFHFRHDFGTNAVAGEQQKLVTGHGDQTFRSLCVGRIATGAS
jgi:hypothetical protein